MKKLFQKRFGDYKTYIILMVYKSLIVTVNVYCTERKNDYKCNTFLFWDGIVWKQLP